MGSVARGEADLVAASLTLRPDRARALDYVLPVGETYSAVFVRSSDLQDAVSWGMFLQPFSSRVWVLIAAATAAYTALIKSRLCMLRPPRPGQPEPAAVGVPGA